MGEVVDQIGVVETPLETNPEAAADRRRPGRAEVSESLLPLLRTRGQPYSPPASTMEIAPEGEPQGEPGEDTLAPARGIAFGLLLSVPLWALIAVIVAVLIR